MKKICHSVIAFSLVAVPRWVLAADPPPASCQGGEQYSLTVEASLDGGFSWQSDSVSVCGLPNHSIDLAVRTVLTVTSGAVDAWSFSLRHDPAPLRYYGGNLTLNGVTTVETGTATVKDGSAPDMNSTAIRTGFNGYTQGVLIDNEQAIRLGPVQGFVTSCACYRITVPPYPGSYQATISYTHDIGNPVIWTVVCPGDQSIVPCVKNLTLHVCTGSLYWYYYPSYPACNLPAGPTADASTAGAPADVQGAEATDAEAAEANRGARGQACPVSLVRGDDDDNSLVDISEAISMISYHFLEGPKPHYLTAADPIPGATSSG